MTTNTMTVSFELCNFRITGRESDKDRGGWINFAAEIIVNGQDEFTVRHTAYIGESGLVRATDAMDHDVLNSDLRTGLGVLAMAAKDEIEDMLFAAACEEFADEGDE